MKMIKECPHCKFLNEVFSLDYNGPENNREYWIFTETFVYLHGGVDYCNHNENWFKKWRKLRKPVYRARKKGVTLK